MKKYIVLLLLLVSFGISYYITQRLNWQKFVVIQLHKSDLPKQERTISEEISIASHKNRLSNTQLRWGDDSAFSLSVTKAKSATSKATRKPNSVIHTSLTKTSLRTPKATSSKSGLVIHPSTATKTSPTTPKATSKAGLTIHPSENEPKWSTTTNASKGGLVNQTTNPLILLYHKLHGSTNWWFRKTDKDFLHCPHQCQISSDISLYSKADMVVFECPRAIISWKGEEIKLRYFQDEGLWPSKRGNPRQVRLFFAREPQTAGLSGDDFSFASSMFNYSMTFQQKADIFYPYGHTEKLQSTISIPNYGAPKTRLVLWIVSNCMSQRRMKYKLELEKYIQVDMIGRCNKTHGDPCKRNYSCLIKLKHEYKFYLAFENSNCEEYITEKFWKALNEQMVPIVMGTTREIYERVAPPNSFIHVDDFESPKLLADYLKLLDGNDNLYNQYHKWRVTDVIRWNSANCDMCRLAAEKPVRIANISQLWNTKTQCVR